MAIRFLCPTGHRLKVSEEMIGKQVRCARCKQTAIVPEKSTRPPSKQSSPGERSNTKTEPGTTEPARSDGFDEVVQGVLKPAAKPEKPAQGGSIDDVIDEALGPAKRSPTPKPPPAEASAPTLKKPESKKPDTKKSGPQKPDAQKPEPENPSAHSAPKPPPIPKPAEAGSPLGDAPKDAPSKKSGPPAEKAPPLPKGGPGEANGDANRQGATPKAADKGPEVSTAESTEEKPKRPERQRKSRDRKKPPVPPPPETLPQPPEAESKDQGKDEAAEKPSKEPLEKSLEKRDRRSRRDHRRGKRKRRKPSVAEAPETRKSADAEPPAKQPKRRRARRQKAPRGPRRMPIDTYRADASKLISVRWLAFFLYLALAFSVLPLFWGGYLNPETMPWWARLVMLVALVQGVYVAWMLAAPDWASVWVVMFVFAGVSTLYGMVTAIAVASPLDKPLPLGLGDVRQPAKTWCSSVLLVMALATYLAGRAASRWRRAFELEIAARLRRR